MAEKKALDRDGTVLENPDIRIADDVIASIAALAATEIEGEAGMAGNITNEYVGKFGVKNLSKGVKVNLYDGSMDVALSLIVRYGSSIPEVSAKGQERVKAMIENMTGLIVENVSVNIVGMDASVDETS